ncbi:DUF4352 domain-containing protein [Nonomuraea lactucae]|uniref:DUF4352 domain-containing protein n=1 Tax=Nonomuraea lactucae TaxID=2249762 RepID=UPI000DE2CA5B|nr:DUF4352 domain-containing protein [Nonomuraea lactucae]
MTYPYGQDQPGYPPQQPYPPQGGYGYPPGPPPRRKKKSNAPMVLAIIGAVVLVLFGGCAVLVAAVGGGGDGKPRSTTAAEQPAGDDEPKGEAKTAGIGTEVRDGKFAFTVTKVEKRARVGSELLGTDAQGVFLLVHITVENIGDEAQAFTSTAQKLHAGGKEYEADAGAAIYLKDSKSLYEKINPGNNVKGVVLFDVPKNLKPETLELHDSVFSDGVKVSLS